MNQDLSIFNLVMHASLIVQAVLGLLLLVSLLSWSVIFRKLAVLKRTRWMTENFDQRFWSGASLNELHRATLNAKQLCAQEIVFAAGMHEFHKLKERDLPLAGLVDGARRAMSAAYRREMDALESSMSMLASIGSVSPYVGLFGTVWGIMHAFNGLANLQSVTLANVAPGIAEALVATAVGLFAAIPAVVAFNFFSRDIDRIATHLESFIEDFTNILQRQSANLNQAFAAGAPTAR